MKKGFTLVELLAVIIVLSIISLILVPSTFNLIEDIRNATEVERARTLLDLANNYIIEQRLHGTPIREEQIFVIKGKTEYKVDKLGNRVETNYFEQEKEVCDYCVIKINVDKDVYVLYEGKNQDVIKEYNDSTFSSIKLEVPREVKSLYNEFNIFKDIYASNNNITSTKYFKINEQKIYEVDSNGNETEKYSLYNSNGISSVTNISKLYIKEEKISFPKKDCKMLASTSPLYILQSVLFTSIESVYKLTSSVSLFQSKPTPVFVESAKVSSTGISYISHSSVSAMYSYFK